MSLLSIIRYFLIFFELLIVIFLIIFLICLDRINIIHGGVIYNNISFYC